MSLNNAINIQKIKNSHAANMFLGVGDIIELVNLDSADGCINVKEHYINKLYKVTQKDIGTGIHFRKINGSSVGDNDIVFLYGYEFILVYKYKKRYRTYISS